MIPTKWLYFACDGPNPRLTILLVAILQGLVTVNLPCFCPLLIMIEADILALKNAASRKF